MLEKLEIAVSTYNRSQIMNKWFDSLLPSIDRFEILVSIYDSSQNDETERLIDKLNQSRKGDQKIRYSRVATDTRVDAKVLSSILNAQREYVWPMGDSRIFDLESLNEKGDCCFKKDIGFIIFDGKHRDEDEKIYDDPAFFFHDWFYSSLMLGAVIFQKNIFASLNNQSTMDYFMSKYCRNDGFSYLGIFYELIIGNTETKGLFVNLGIQDISLHRKQNWLKRHMEVWFDNLYYLVNCLPKEYAPYKDETLRIIWGDMSGWYWLLSARIENGINSVIYKRYTNNHTLERVTEHRGRIKLVAYMPVYIAKVTLLLYTKIYPTIRRTIKQIQRVGK